MEVEAAKEKLKEAQLFPINFNLLPPKIAEAIQHEKGLEYLMEISDPNTVMVLALDQDASIATAFNTLGGIAFNITIGDKKAVVSLSSDAKKLPRDLVLEIAPKINDSSIVRRRLNHFNAAFAKNERS